MITAVVIMQEESKVGPRGQIVIPKVFRDALRLRPGERMLVELQGDRIVLRRRPRSYAHALRGLHSGLWQGVDAAAYLDEERRGWDQAEGTRGPGETAPCEGPPAEGEGQADEGSPAAPAAGGEHPDAPESLP